MSETSATMAKEYQSAILTVDIPIELLDPNDYNPNRMTEAEFNEFVAEIIRLGRLPKPVVARPNSRAGRYTIIDGEHGWRAATKAGLKRIPCEIIEADDFEAMRQTYKRNQHGTHTPILLGRFFRRMMEDRGLSQRALAKEIEVSEGSIRNALHYEQAAGVRNDYAWEKLTVRQVRLYNHLPRSIGDLWLDTSANVKELLGCEEEEANRTVAELERAERKDEEKERLRFSRWEYLAQTGLVEIVRQIPNWRYRGFRRLVSLMEDWVKYEYRWTYNGITPGRLRPFTRYYFLGTWQVREARMMDNVLELVIDTTTTPASLRLTAAEFDALMKELSDLKDNSASALKDLLKAAILNKGITLPHWRELISAEKKLIEAEIDHLAPDYIKQSMLDLRPKYRLWKAEGREDVKRDIAVNGIKHSVLMRHDDDDRVEWCVEHEIKTLTAEADLKADWEKLSIAELVAGIGGRWGLYDPLTQADQIKRLSGVLTQLTRAELMWLYRYTRYMQEWGSWQDTLKSLAQTINGS